MGFPYTLSQKRGEIECDVVCECGARHFIGYKNVIVRSRGGNGKGHFKRRFWRNVPPYILGACIYRRVV